MQVITGIVLLLKFCLAGVVGVRLLRIPSEGALSPERALGWFFLVAGVAGGILITAAYGIWSSQGQAESAGLVSQLHAAGQCGISLGFAMVLVFTQSTFYPDSPMAAATAYGVIGILIASLIGRAAYEGFAISLDPGLFHWIGYYCRMFGLVWASWAAFSYWNQMKRRAALGLADPVVTNRFLLWGMWASGTCLTAFSEPIARLLYGWLTGAEAATAQSIQEVGGSLITITLCITSLLALTTSVILFLAFFPTQSYRGWVLNRSATKSA